MRASRSPPRRGPSGASRSDGQEWALTPVPPRPIPPAHHGDRPPAVARYRARPDDLTARHHARGSNGAPRRVAVARRVDGLRDCPPLAKCRDWYESLPPSVSEPPRPTGLGGQASPAERIRVSTRQTPASEVRTRASRGRTPAPARRTRAPTAQIRAPPGRSQPKAWTQRKPLPEWCTRGCSPRCVPRHSLP